LHIIFVKVKYIEYKIIKFALHCTCISPGNKAEKLS
jgi:hypothetical protein